MINTLKQAIESLKGRIADAYSAVSNKGGTLPSTQDSANLPAAIESIPSGTQNKVVIPYNMRVSDAMIIDGYWAGELVDTSLMTTMVEMFFQRRGLQQLDVSNWDTSKVTGMTYMFYECSYLQQLDVSNWNVSKVTGMGNMFFGCSSLQQLDVSKWDVSNVTSMSGVFASCSSLQQLDVSNWDVSNVTSMDNTFSRCSQLQQLDVSKWDVSNVVNMAEMFIQTISLQSLDLTSWDMSNVANINYLFYDNTSLQSIVGYRTIDEVIVGNIGCLNGININIPSTAFFRTILDRASLRAVINGLADRTGQDALTLTIGATLLAKLTEEDIAVATAKNWTIA